MHFYIFSFVFARLNIGHLDIYFAIVSFVFTISHKVMVYSHCTGPGLGMGQGKGPGSMCSNICRNVHRGQDPLFPIVPILFPVPPRSWSRE